MSCRMSASPGTNFQLFSIRRGRGRRCLPDPVHDGILSACSPDRRDVQQGPRQGSGAASFRDSFAHGGRHGVIKDAIRKLLRFFRQMKPSEVGDCGVAIDHRRHVSPELFTVGLRYSGDPLV